MVRRGRLDVDHTENTTMGNDVVGVDPDRDARILLGWPGQFGDYERDRAMQDRDDRQGLAREMNESRVARERTLHCGSADSQGCGDVIP